ncbi:unnamed protein product [Adineta steineri]|uniref:Uncharacterized protein n=1 Tax=Adineta steineri TaxID=433720 RepID=A0A814AB55_9BILA|nr:unnamed protein product [Adineta steineri]CAF1422610.1 unnamed protein product [Adineta steineri]
MVRGEDEGMNQAAKLNNVLRHLMNQRQGGCGVSCTNYATILSCSDACSYLAFLPGSDYSSYYPAAVGALFDYGCRDANTGGNCGNSANSANCICNPGK